MTRQADDQRQGSPQGRLDASQDQNSAPYSGERHVVYLRGTDGWIDQQIGSDSDNGTYATRDEAIAAARERIGRKGGGELIIKRHDGEIENRLSVEPGADDKSSRVVRGTEVEAGVGVSAQEAAGWGPNRSVNDK